MHFIGNRHCYICGDFNINLLKQDVSKDTDIFINNIFSYGYYPLINRPTRITQSCATLIDNIFTNVKNYHDITSGIIISDVSYHLPIFSFNKNEKYNAVKQNIYYSRKLDKKN